MKITGITPLNDWVVIIPAEEESRTAGGIYIPDSAMEEPQTGIVEAVGPGIYEEEKKGKDRREKGEKRFVPTVVRPGDHVVYARYATEEFTIGNAVRYLVREKDIFAILLEKPSLRPEPRDEHAGQDKKEPAPAMPLSGGTGAAAPSESPKSQAGKPRAEKKPAMKKAVGSARKKSTKAKEKPVPKSRPKTKTKTKKK